MDFNKLHIYISTYTLKRIYHKRTYIWTTNI